MLHATHSPARAGAIRGYRATIAASREENRPLEHGPFKRNHLTLEARSAVSITAE